jgi:hypothetical protein
MASGIFVSHDIGVLIKAEYLFKGSLMLATKFKVISKKDINPAKAL